MAIQNGLGPRPGGTASALDVSTIQVIKDAPGTVYRVNLTTVGTSVAGGIYDCMATTAVAASNLICSIPNSAGTAPILLEWPCEVGIVFDPGPGQTASISYT